jgi:glutamate 5-kinase
MKKMLTKIGTEQLCGANGRLSQKIFDNIARQIALTMKLGISVALVSSGAVKAGRERAERYEVDTKSWVEKDYAGIGSVTLMKMWGNAFARFGIETAQVWVTHSDLRTLASRKNILSCLLHYADSKVVAIINENDVVSATEIFLWLKKISENDQLAQKICDLIDADIVAFVTSVGGVFDSNPKDNSNAKMYQELNLKKLPREILRDTSKSQNGKGGMKNKVIQAGKCCLSRYFGIFSRWNDRRVGIINAENEAIYRFALGEAVGTLLGSQNIIK